MNTIQVNADALRQVLLALSGPGHLIREMQATRSLPVMEGEEPNPINELARAFHEATRREPPTGTQPAAILPAFMGVAKRKLDDLLARGFKIDGFSIAKYHDEGDAEVATGRGFITVGGFVGWWRSEEEIRRIERNAAEKALAQEKPEFPSGAIFNGRAHIDRLEHNYRFDCEAGPLEMCHDWLGLKACFECLAATAPPAIKHLPADDTEGGCAG